MALTNYERGFADGYDTGIKIGTRTSNYIIAIDKLAREFEELVRAETDKDIIIEKLYQLAEWKKAGLKV